MKKIGVVGTGVLGPQLAGLFAGCGASVILFGRKGKAISAVAGLKKLRPPAIYTANDLESIEPADIERDIDRIAECDWVVECIQENVEAKRRLFGNIGPKLRDDAIITSGTSGLTRKRLTEGMDENIRSRFFITHFFYPPRYMRLTEMVTDDEVDAEAMEKVASFLKNSVGKGIVFAKDTPNFIANRIGVQYVMDAMHLVVERGWPLEAVDTVMGEATGRPSTGIFRMADMVGIDTVAMVAGTVVSQLTHDPRADRCRIPQYMQKMIVNGWTGAKTGQGFYKREGEKRFVIDPARLSYRPTLRFMPHSVVDVAAERNAAERIRKMVWADDPGGEIAWTMVSNSIVYAAEVAREISDDVESIDRAMRWGYGWELGPFETWEALGVDAVCRRLEQEGRRIPPNVQGFGKSRSMQVASDLGVVYRNNSGDLTATRDDTALITFYATKKSFDENCLSLMHESLNIAEREWRGVVVTGEDDSFPGWMNFYDLLNKTRLGKWKDINSALIALQGLSQRIRYFRKPIVFAPASGLRGVGAEVCLAAPYRHFWVESTVWMDHLLMGLVPAAGGCLNLLKQCGEIEKTKGIGPHPKVKRAFEILGSAARSISAIDSKASALAMPSDGVAMNRELLLDDTIAALLEISADYVAPQPVPIVLTGRGGEMALRNDMRNYRQLGMLSPDNAVVCARLARILSGGDRATIHQIDERHVLDLEREAFLSLLGTETTQKRIEHFLKTGRYMR